MQVRQQMPRSRRMLFLSLATLAASIALVFSANRWLWSADNSTDAKPASLQIHPGDHICLIGNTLADRMQHDGWLEAYLYSRFPKDNLVVRDLGFSGDELTFRQRSAGFGTPDDHLTRTKADVVFAFFGYNESFAGVAGLDKFKHDLTDFIHHTQSEKYNGKSAPQLVLFSPIANENLHDRNLPDGSENNWRLEQYTTAMAEVAKANHVPMVDLYEPTLKAYAQAPKPLTINGIHLTPHGDEVVAQVIDQSLLAGAGGAAAGQQPNRDPQAMEKLRQAIADKDLVWFNRYRTLDGYSIFGGRADLAFVNRQTNRDVADREMEVLDIMTANRDKRIWAVAQGGDLKVDDSNTPPFLKVITNKPGKGPHGEHIYLTPEQELKTMTVAKGLKVTEWASEQEFPLLEKAVQMSFDPKGRLWVTVWPSYPHWKPKDPLNDKILILEDTKGTGHADKCTVFADHLNCPTGFEFYNGGVIVADAPSLLFLKDSTGGDHADIRIRVLDGIDSADTHHTANSFTLDPGGAMYFQEGTFMHTQVETPYGPSFRNANAGVYRYEPRTQKFEAYVTYGFANPHGHAWNRWGEDVVMDATGAEPYHGALFSGHLDFPEKHSRPPKLYEQRTRPCPGIAYLSSRQFPASMQGDLLVCNVIGFQGILRYKVDEDGSSFHGTELSPILSSTDENFRPVDLKIGPDGALYFIDWQNPLIGHMQHNLRDPSRDHTHGRIYRVVAEDRPLLKPAKIAGEPIDKLLDLLKQPDDQVRYRARIELGGRNSDEVVAALQKWVPSLDPKDPQYEHNMLEALWAYQYQNVVNLDLLHRELASPDYRARRAAVRVLVAWRDRVPDALALLKKLAADPSPQVRLHAVRAASFFTQPEAVEVPLVSTEYPSDKYLDYVRGETMKALEPYVKKAIAEGLDLPLTSPAAARYFFKNVSTDDLLKMKRSQAVDLELLFRRGIRDELRHEALSSLSKVEGKSELDVLLAAIRGQDELQGSQDDTVVFDLVRLLTNRDPSELAGVRDQLEKMATSAKLPVTRQLGFVALVAADGSAERAWAIASKSLQGLRDLATAMPLIHDPGERASLYPKVEPLVAAVPKELASAKSHSKQTFGRYVRIELPGRGRTLTLAEVEVYSDGHNLARQGKATQKNTYADGAASRAIDGNTSPDWGNQGQSHTQENTSNPWWEVDLGSESPIESIAIYNRGDGLSQRLQGFTLRVLDNQRKVVYEKLKQPAPDLVSKYELGGESPDDAVRRAAMVAITSVRGQETAAFKAIAPFVGDDNFRAAAIEALHHIPAAYWPKEEAKPVTDSLLAYVRKVPVAERNNPDVLDAIQFGDNLAALLPPDDAKHVRKELGELGVRVVRLATLPEKMEYDKERLVVQAGKPVEIVLENNDLMPHNFVIVEPGSMEEVGTLAETTGLQPDAFKRQFVPRSNKVLFHGRLLQPRETERLSFTAPSKPGVYPYICTFPGHWRRMYGALYVVENLEDYQAAPEAYLAKHVLPINDALLKFNRPRTEWKFDDLRPLAENMDHGRNFADGKQMFTVASCIACHRLNNVGTQVGADLTKIDPKWKPVDVLHKLVDPSEHINDKFYTYILSLDTGKTVTGLITEETADTVKLMENPLAKCEPTIVKKSSIEGRKKSNVSIMPKGLLEKLTKEEILDLVAYVYSHGDPHNKLFQGGNQTASR
ncbi:MAG TPA: PVC-type heme-binding CxxCH protein [Pirellulales bacterium]|jgi:putative heme-binding domain-containing protein|nr:PVC-type heme-binding CxxCH protein [Pirellulales bacterium]